MAILAKLPSEAIISGFKGVIDYYLWMGIPCARKWPNKPQGARSPAVVAAQIPFTDAVAAYQLTSQSVRDAYKLASSGTGYSGYELFIQGYIKGIYSTTHP